MQEKKTRLCSQVMRLPYTLGHKDQNASPQSGFVVVVVCFFLRQEYWTVAQAGLELCKISCPSIQKPKYRHKQLHFEIKLYLKDKYYHSY